MAWKERTEFERESVCFTDEPRKLKVSKAILHTPVSLAQR